MDGMTLPPSPMQALQAQHERLLGRLDDAGGAPCHGSPPPEMEKLSLETQALIHEARAYIERSKAESEWVSDGRDRNQLRANLRFWASFLLSCTGVYPDTTLRPARPFAQGFSGLPKTTSSGSAAVTSSAAASVIESESAEEDRGALEEETDDQVDEVLEDEQEMLPEKTTWLSRASRFLGLFAILIVGVIPLAAVCLALSLFYNLDNQSPWVFPGNAATQTATAALLLPSASPRPILIPSQTPTTTGTELPRLIAEVSFGESASHGSGCDPVLLLSFDAPKQVGGTPIPESEFAVYQAGVQEPVAQGKLESGAAAISINLERDDAGPAKRDWLVKFDHPWLGMDAVILSDAMLADCTQNQVSIVYRSQPGTEVWQQAKASISSGDLNLDWMLLNWGPDALEQGDWVADVKLIATGGNESYVFFVQGDLASSLSARNTPGMLPGDQVVLGQKLCDSAVAQVGVTSAGQSLSRVLAVQLVLPACR